MQGGPYLSSHGYLPAPAAISHPEHGTIPIGDAPTADLKSWEERVGPSLPIVLGGRPFLPTALP